MRKETHGPLDIGVTRWIALSLSSYSSPIQRERVFVAMPDGRVEREGRVEIFQRAVEEPEMRGCDASISKCIGVGLVLGDGAIEIDHRAVGIAHVEEDDAAIVERVRVVWIEADGFVVITYRPVELFLCPKRVAAIIEGIGRVRIEPNGPLVIADGPVKVADAAIRDPAIDQRSIVLWIRKDDGRARVHSRRRCVSETLTPGRGLSSGLDRSRQAHGGDQLEA